MFVMRLTLAVLLSLVFVVNFQRAHAQVPGLAWQALGPFGGDVQHIAHSPASPSTVVAGSNSVFSSKFLRSTDGGATWQVSNPFPDQTIFSLRFVANGRLFAATSGGMWVSDDAGTSFARYQLGAFAPIGVQQFAFSAEPVPTALWVAPSRSQSTDPALIRSLDGGTTFSALSLPVQLAQFDQVRSIAVSAGAQASVYTVAIAVSSNVGANAAVFVSTDSGNTWVNRSAGLPTNNVLNKIEFIGAELYLVGGQSFANQRFGAFRSTDLGQTWTALHDSSWPSLAFNDVELLSDGTLVLATANLGVYRRSPAQVWTLGVPGASVAGLNIRALSTDGTTLLVGGEQVAVLASTDFGSSFVSSRIGVNLLRINDIVVNPFNVNDLIASSSNDGNSGGVYGSLNGGQNWQFENVPATRFGKATIASDQSVFVVSTGPTTIATEGLYRRLPSFDPIQNRTWVSIGPDTGPLFDTDLGDVETSANTPGLIFTGGSNRVGNQDNASIWRADSYGTNNSGPAWQRVYTGSDYKTLEIALGDDGKHLLAVLQKTRTLGDGITLIRSEDNGNTWSPANSGLAQQMINPSLCRAADSPQHFFLSALTNTPQGMVLYETNDAGLSWQVRSSSGINQYIDLLCDPNDATKLYIATVSRTQAGIQDVQRSINGGQTFTSLGQLPSLALNLALSPATTTNPARLVAATLNGVYSLPLAASGELFKNGFE
jgi:photosystem II stability/assembly factor-like uncharacterized protein